MYLRTTITIDAFIMFPPLCPRLFIFRSAASGAKSLVAVVLGHSDIRQTVERQLSQKTVLLYAYHFSIQPHLPPIRRRITIVTGDVSVKPPRRAELLSGSSLKSAAKHISSASPSLIRRSRHHVSADRASFPKATLCPAWRPLSALSF